MGNLNTIGKSVSAFNTSFASGATIVTASPTTGLGAVALRVTVSLATASKFGCTISDGTTTTAPQALNKGDTLVADVLYPLVFTGLKDYTYEFQHFGSGGAIVVNYLTVDEILGGEI